MESLIWWLQWLQCLQSVLPIQWVEWEAVRVGGLLAWLLVWFQQECLTICSIEQVRFVNKKNWFTVTHCRYNKSIACVSSSETKPVEALNNEWNSSWLNGKHKHAWHSSIVWTCMLLISYMLWGGCRFVGRQAAKAKNMSKLSGDIIVPWHPGLKFPLSLSVWKILVILLFQRVANVPQLQILIAGHTW